MLKLHTRGISALTILVVAGTLSVAQDFQFYPGSKLDEKAGLRASSVLEGMECHVYTTSDSFDKVYSFYKAHYNEIPVPFPKQKISDGKEVRWAFFVLDGARDLQHSAYWMKIQRPYIRGGDDSAAFDEIRDISVIETVRNKAAALNHRRRPRVAASEPGH